VADFDNQRRTASRAENLRLTRMPPLPPRTGLPAAPPPVRAEPEPEPAAPARKRRRGWLAGLVVLLVTVGAGVSYRWNRDAGVGPAPTVATSFPVVEGPPDTTPSRQVTPTVTKTPKGSPKVTPKTGGKANPGGTNLALRGACTASGVEGDPWLADYACDGDPQTRWSSAFDDNQWLRADLGQRWRLTDVTLVWERSYAASYRVETSLDGKTWHKLYATRAGKGGTVRIPAKGATARYVRMVGVKRVSQYGYSLMEFEVR
jgi:hypothetical protein